MLRAASPFPLPHTLERDLERVHAVWDGLRRAGNAMPFWDDLRPAALATQAGTIILLDVFEKPERFRFSLADANLVPAQEAALTGRFIDEIDLDDGFAFLRAQASATVEARAPTYFRCGSRGLSPGFVRLLLPMWGDGRIGMLLGAIDRY
jgi:hypothetical protein